MPATSARLPHPYRDELAVLDGLMAGLSGATDWPAAVRTARPWVQAVRDNPAPFWAMESLLREYPISSAEGLALMRLAEALLRVPDAETAIALTADQLGKADFDAASGGPHKMLASISASAISLSKKFLPDSDGDSGLFKRLGAQTVVAATVRAIQLLGRQFVLGRSIKEAMNEAADARKAQRGLRFSYDMLGRGCADRSGCAALPCVLPQRDQRDRRQRHDPGRERPRERGRHFDQAQRAVLAIRRRATRARFRRIAAARVAAHRAGGARRHQPHDRCRGKRPPRTLARNVSMLLAQRIATSLSGNGSGLGFVIQAYQTALRCMVIDWIVARLARAGPAAASWSASSRALTGTPRSSARRKPGLADYPGLHPQGPHRPRLCRLRPQASRLARCRCDLPAVRHAQCRRPLPACIHLAGPELHRRGDYEFQCLHGMGEGALRAK